MVTSPRKRSSSSRPGRSRGDGAGAVNGARPALVADLSAGRSISARSAFQVVANHHRFEEFVRAKRSARRRPHATDAIVATAAVHAHDEKVRAADNPNVIGNGSGILAVRLRAPKDTARVRVTISSDLILEPSVFSGTLATQGEEYRINPRPRG